MFRMCALFALLIVSTGCSTLMAKPEPRELWPKLEYTSCTESKVAPTLDALGGGWELGAGLVALAVGAPTAFINLILGGLLVWSSSEGSSNADDCKALRNHLAAGKRSSRDSEDDEEIERKNQKKDSEVIKKEIELEKQKLEYEKLKLEVEKEKLELQRIRMPRRR